jgi:radical SAM superfamily enzyme YgiQ (UPF0313 family)
MHTTRETNLDSGWIQMKWSHIKRARSILDQERGTIHKDWGGRLPVALVYPNTYRVGMSSLGLQTLYRLLNAPADVVCERAFWQPHLATASPAATQSGDPIVSLESQRPLSEFDVIAFSLSFEMDYPHLVQLLRQAGIPLRADERDETWPLVIAGGPAVSANPLPVADFLDAVFIGEVEEIIEPLIEVLWDTRTSPRDDAWKVLARIPGVYTPQWEGDLKAIQHVQRTGPAQDGRKQVHRISVQRQWVRDLDDYPTATVVRTPDTEFGNVHLIEIARGCGRGCRFCMAGFTYRPKRERSLEPLLDEARRGLQWGTRIGLVGAAVSDHSQIDELALRLREMGAQLSVSSLRVDPLSEPLLHALAESNTQTLTLAPEAGSERLRRLINKGVTEAHVLFAAERAQAHRFRQLKLYFMLGLPTEEEGDVEAIVELCEAVAARFSGRVTANVTPFVPKAHTPFQWMAFTPAKIVQSRLRTLQKRLGKRGIPVKGESPMWAAIQALLARGDRRLGAVLASLDGTSLSAWKKALAEHGLRSDDLLDAREIDDPLPWEFIHTGVRTAYLKHEWERAQIGALTSACLPSDCTRCGVCPGD